MDHHVDQPSSHVPTHSEQLAVLTWQNKRLISEILPYEVKHYRHQDELNILLNTAKQLKFHYFAVEKQPNHSLSEKASQVSRTAFLSYLVEIYGAQLTKGSVLFICDALTNTYISLIYDILFNPLSDTLFEILDGIWSEIHSSDREMVFWKSSFEFHKRPASNNANASQSRQKNVQKIARQVIKGFTHLLKIYITPVKNADLDDEEILDSLTLLSWYIHRFWKSLVRHVFPATELIADTLTQKLPELPDTLHYIYDSQWFPQNFVNIPEIPSETIQKLILNRECRYYNSFSVNRHLSKRNYRNRFLLNIITWWNTRFFPHIR